MYIIVSGCVRPGAYDLGIVVDHEATKAEAVRRARKFLREIGVNVPVVIAQVSKEFWYRLDEDDPFRDWPGDVKRLWSNMPHAFAAEQHTDHDIELIDL